MNPLLTTQTAEVNQVQAPIDKAGVAPVPAIRTAPRRNTAIDAYRGFVMLLMMAEVLRFSEMAQAFPTNWFWKILSYNQTHVDWAGCSLHDMIQPSFSFLVGVALPYSIASRLAKGAGFGKLLLHAIWRAFLLIALGIFLRSMHQPQTYFTFEDTLTQIGMGYVFLFMLGFAEKERWLWISLEQFFSPTGWLGLSILRRAQGSIGSRSAFHPIGPIITRDSWRTGTRTPI